MLPVITYSGHKYSQPSCWFSVVLFFSLHVAEINVKVYMKFTCNDFMNHCKEFEKYCRGIYNTVPYLFSSAGKTNVAVSFSCEFSASRSKTQSMFYSSSMSVSVVPDLPLALGVPITWILPPHYTTTSLLPSSSESFTQFDSQNRKGTINYSLLSSLEKNEALQKDAISIDEDRIKTTASNNLACIQAKDRSTGRTEIASCVKVAEVWNFISHLLLSWGHFLIVL